MQIAKRNACKMTVKSLNIRKLNGRFEYETQYKVVSRKIVTSLDYLTHARLAWPTIQYHLEKSIFIPTLRAIGKRSVYHPVSVAIYLE